jgi:dGTPase
MWRQAMCVLNESISRRKFRYDYDCYRIKPDRIAQPRNETRINMTNDMTDRREQALLAPYAMFSRASQGRVHAEPEHPYRGPFQRDRDRILHSAAFRRLSGKMQVFTGSMGDYHRTRLTHTMEVASIARTIARSLRLNEDLVEALGLLHDIGHPPFGHAGEDALNDCLADEGGFSHNRFAITLVTEIENPYASFPGLNLTREVLASQESRIDKHHGHIATLLEAQVVDAADSTSYDAHDVDDSVKLDLLKIEQLLELDLVRLCHEHVIQRHGQLDAERLRRALVHELIDVQVTDTVENSLNRLLCENFASSDAASRCGFAVVAPSDPMLDWKRELESFLYEHVYRHPELIRVRADFQRRLRAMFDWYATNPARLPPLYQRRGEAVGFRSAIRDYLAGMTDHFCLQTYDLTIGKIGQP